MHPGCRLEVKQPWIDLSLEICLALTMLEASRANGCTPVGGMLLVMMMISLITGLGEHCQLSVSLTNASESSLPGI